MIICQVPSKLKNELSDIDRLDAHIEKILEPGQDKGKEERIIRAGYFLLSGIIFFALVLTEVQPKQSRIGRVHGLTKASRTSPVPNDRYESPSKSAGNWRLQ